MWFHAGLAAPLDLEAVDRADEVVGVAAGRQANGSLVLIKGAGATPTPVRFALPATRGDVFRQALGVAERFRLAARRVAHCGVGDRSCVARLLVDQALTPLETTPDCRLVLDRPREGEVLLRRGAPRSSLNSLSLLRAA